jgi:hypothetical protein
MEIFSLLAAFMSHSLNTKVTERQNDDYWANFAETPGVTNKNNAMSPNKETIDQKSFLVDL